MVRVDKKRSLEVHINPENQGRSGNEVLRRCTKEYYRQLHDRQSKSRNAIECLMDVKKY